MNARRHTQLIKNLAAETGFDFCGVARADFLEEEAPRLEKWLNRGMHGDMAWLENHFDKRLDPRKLVPGAKSVVVLMLNYYPEEDLADQMPYKLAKYAYGKDYHWVVKPMLRDLLERIRERVGDVEGRCFVDSAPVMERAWAERAGVGWTGKNALTLNRQGGSFFFLAELIIDLELEPDSPMRDYCGTCTACIDACPTDAIPSPGLVDGSKCISYLTIELKDGIPDDFTGLMDDWMFGCDICQDVCPWNRFSKPHKTPEFAPHEKLAEMSKREWDELTRETFNEVFKKSAVKRAKYEGLKRNIAFLNR